MLSVYALAKRLPRRYTPRNDMFFNSLSIATSQPILIILPMFYNPAAKNSAA
jgi:hypothetical protein